MIFEKLLLLNRYSMLGSMIPSLDLIRSQFLGQCLLTPPVIPIILHMLMPLRGIRETVFEQDTQLTDNW